RQAPDRILLAGACCCDAQAPDVRLSPVDRASTRGAGLVQMRWKTSVPRTLTTWPFGPTYVAIHRVTTVVGLTNRPCPTVVTLQSAVQFREVWNTTRGPWMRPTMS